MIKLSTKRNLLSKAIMTGLICSGISGVFASSSAFAQLSCEIGSSQFFSKSVIIKDVEVTNSGQSIANTVRIALTFDQPVEFVKAWGDVEKSPAINGKTITFNTKSASIQPNGNIDFGLKAGNVNDTSSVTCQVLRGNSAPVTQTPVTVESTPSRPARPNTSKPSKPVVSAPKRPARPNTSKPSKPVASAPSSNDKCPTSNNGSLLVQNFENFDLGKPGMNDRRKIQKKFCNAPYTMAGFSADDETFHDDPEEARKARGRAAAGQREHAQDFVRFEFVNDDNALSGKSLKVLYPKGGNTSSHSGMQYPELIPTAIYHDRDTNSFVGENRFQEMYVSYWVKFEDNFPWQLGGKLPGMIAELGYKDPNRDERVNTRLMWRENGKLEFYIHSPYLKDKTAGKAYDDRIFWDNGNQINGHAKLTKGKWHHIEFRMKLNDVIDGVVYPNGELEGWLDGKHAAYYNDVTLRGDADFNINTFFFSTFYGGSSGEGQFVWWPLKDSHAYFDQIEVSDKRIGCCNRK